VRHGHAAIAAGGGVYAEGRFDAHRRDVPYAGVSAAFGGLVSELFLSATAPRSASIALNLVAILCGMAVHVAPWDRWPDRTSLVLVPLAFALLAIGQRVAPGAPSTYGVWFVVVFAWIGFWHPRHSAAWFAPLGAVAYVAPFIGVTICRHSRTSGPSSHASGDAAAGSVATKVPAEVAKLTEADGTTGETIEPASTEPDSTA
jgi:hypothetical protein